MTTVRERGEKDYENSNFHPEGQLMEEASEKSMTQHVPQRARWKEEKRSVKDSGPSMKFSLLSFGHDNSRL